MMSGRMEAVTGRPTFRARSCDRFTADRSQSTSRRWLGRVTHGATLARVRPPFAKGGTVAEAQPLKDRQLPIDLLQTQLGAELVEDVLTGLEYHVYC